MIGSSQDSLIRIKQVDDNGTLINAPTVMVGKYKHNYDFNDSVLGYHLVKDNKLSGSFTRDNQNITLKYKSEATPKNVYDRIKKNKYILSAGQQLNTTGANGFQIKGNRKPVYRLRLFVSKNATDWDLLTIDYPNVQLDNPSVYWNGNQLFVYDKNTLLKTTNFMNWQVKKWNNNSQKSVEKSMIFYDRNNKAHVLLKTNNRHLAGISGLSYASINNKNGAVRDTWTGLKVQGTLTNIESISYVGNHYVMLENSKNNVLQIYTANHLRDVFKLKKQIKSKKYKFESPEIVRTKNKNYLMYTLVNKKTKDSYGVRYKRITPKGFQVGKEKAPDIPIIVNNFSVARIRG